MNAKVFAAVWVAMVGCLLGLSSLYSLVLLLTSAVLALVMTDLAVKLFDIYWRTREQIKIQDKRAVLITGCDTGFGHQLAERLAEKNLKVYAGCLHPDGDGAKELSKNGRIKVVQMDVTKQEDIDNVYSIVKEDLKQTGHSLWSIINNAGIAIMTETEFMAMQDLHLVFDVNTFGPVLVTKTFLPLLRTAQRGRVINVASQAGRFTSHGFLPYSMSKYALIAFSDGLRLEMKKWNISVHTIEPSLYRTSIVDADANRKRMMTDWGRATAEVKAAYGKEYFDGFVAALLQGTAKSSRAVYEVVDDLEDAVLGTRPQIRYTPGNKTKLIVRVLRLLPQCTVDQFFVKNNTKVKPVTAPGE